MARTASEIERAVARTLRDSLETLQRNAQDVDQAVADLVSARDVPRMPPDSPDHITIADLPIPVVKLAPFELSSALKLRLALLLAVSQSSHQQA